MDSIMTDARWTLVGTIDDIPVLGSRVVRTPDGDIALFRTAADEVFALEDACPHKQGPLSQGIVHGRRVTCPLHNWVIELATGEAVAPDEGRTGHVPVRVEGRSVSIALGMARLSRGGCRKACAHV
ncbi:nitrite reductase small subunit NirD [Azospirillum picis]|uniref:Nitrite reductase (NADH) small subunit n=1 Tax=Azospirillum picis TaxID=488438 RepID=A0ABU0MJT8_9PROT|nr:nitrite reductase small subunit NirD [Azospirillum picis]MBP2299850.1 nitrite reductase (NADH) small subunit [Azospirillum picis]MDQ0533646.1 nitrite reductase (NADH) small subunit [Azospirillum picis]